MISKEVMTLVKDALYQNCKNQKYCCWCVGGQTHSEHCFHTGSLKIGLLASLEKIINNILNDTSPQKFRINEACHYLETNGYIRYNDGMMEDKNLFGVVTFFCTPKLWAEMQTLEMNGGPEQSLKSWY